MESERTTPLEIKNIQNFIKTAHIKITKNELKIIIKDLTPLNLLIKDKNYTILINDEYNDLEYNNKILNFILVFRELSLIEDSTDFLHWCKLNSLDANNSRLLHYYINISKELDFIKRCFPNNTIDYFVSDLDFQLSSGMMQLLRK